MSSNPLTTSTCVLCIVCVRVLVQLRSFIEFAANYTRSACLSGARRARSHSLSHAILAPQACRRQSTFLHLVVQPLPAGLTCLRLHVCANICEGTGQRKTLSFAIKETAHMHAGGFKFIRCCFSFASNVFFFSSEVGC